MVPKRSLFGNGTFVGVVMLSSLDEAMRYWSRLLPQHSPCPSLVTAHTVELPISTLEYVNGSAEATDVVATTAATGVPTRRRARTKRGMRIPAQYPPNVSTMVGSELLLGNTYRCVVDNLIEILRHSETCCAFMFSRSDTPLGHAFTNACH